MADQNVIISKNGFTIMYPRARWEARGKDQKKKKESGWRLATTAEKKKHLERMQKSGKNVSKLINEEEKEAAQAGSTAKKIK